MTSGSSATIRDSRIDIKGFGSTVAVKGIDADGAVTVVDTDVTAADGAETTRGIDVSSTGSLTMSGGSVTASDASTIISGTRTNETFGMVVSHPTTLRNVDVAVTDAPPGAPVAGIKSSASALLVRDSRISATSANTDRALQVTGGAATLEGSQIEATGTGDIGIERTGIGSVKVGTSRISAATETSGSSIVCAFSYDAAFAPLSATCG